MFNNVLTFKLNCIQMKNNHNPALTETNWCKHAHTALTKIEYRFQASFIDYKWAACASLGSFITATYKTRKCPEARAARLITSASYITVLSSEQTGVVFTYDIRKMS